MPGAPFAVTSLVLVRNPHGYTNDSEPFFVKSVRASRCFFFFSVAFAIALLPVFHLFGRRIFSFLSKICVRELFDNMIRYSYEVPSYDDRFSRFLFLISYLGFDVDGIVKAYPLPPTALPARNWLKIVIVSSQTTMNYDIVVHAHAC